MLIISHSISDEYFFDKLNEHHAATINDSWTYRSDASYNYIRSMLELNGGLGMFERSTKRILAWILTNDHFAFGWANQTRCHFYVISIWHMWTSHRCLEIIPSARRKGLATILLRKHCRQFAETEQLDIFAYISESNVISMQLFESVGFMICHRCTWVQVKNQLTP